MMFSEFTAMSAIHNIVPNLTPPPIAWGTYETLDDVHSTLSDFHEMTDASPDLESFPAKMTQLYMAGPSPRITENSGFL